MKYKILIIEDEPEIVNLILNRLDPLLYDITVAVDGLEALKYLAEEVYDLMTLDMMLPHVDGLSICKRVREKNKDTLILALTALDMIEQKEKAYALGVDDYIAKPFSAKLIVVKIASLLQRRQELSGEVLIHQEKLMHNNDRKSFLYEENLLTLTLSEYTILKTLFDTPKKVFSKDELSQVLYNKDIGNIDKNGIGTHICQIRKKIALFTEEPLIETIRSIGYKLI